jgi:hypothetical protein
MWRQDYSFVFVILVTCWIHSVTGRHCSSTLSASCFTLSGGIHCVKLHANPTFEPYKANASTANISS